MNRTEHVRQRARRNALLLGAASFLALATGPSAFAQAPPVSPAPAVVAEQAVPETVLITGSLIQGTAAVGVPVTSARTEDFVQTAAPSVSDLLRTLPQIIVPETQGQGAGPGSRSRAQNVSIHDIDGRALFMIDSMRYPGMGDGGGDIDPSIIPSLALDRIEILANGASATYGSDAIAGVINIILRRGFDGAITEARFGTLVSGLGGGRNDYAFQQIWGRTWDGGDITITYGYDKLRPAAITKERLKRQFTTDYTPWGLDDRRNIENSFPGIVSTGAAQGGVLGTACTNCYSIPTGQNGQGLTWEELLANPGVSANNIKNEFEFSGYSPSQERHSFVLTGDLRITENVEWFVTAFHNRRRSNNIQTDGQTPVKDQSRTWRLFDGVSPTGTGPEVSPGLFRVYPYYPAGAPNGLRVAYTLTPEMPGVQNVQEISRRVATGFNVDLPFGWLGKIFYSGNQNSNLTHVTPAVNPNNAMAALGHTITTPASGNLPAVTLSKPRDIPYLNVLCDPQAFQCNDPRTLEWIAGYRIIESEFKLQHFGATFDGPLYSLPGGDLAAAVGAEIVYYDFFQLEDNTYVGPAALAPQEKVLNTFTREVPAAFVQVNVPVFSEINAIPFFERLQFQFSGRYDHYYAEGVILTPNASVEWSPVEGVTFLGSWGESFIAPSLGDVTTRGRLRAHNAAAGNATSRRILCLNAGDTPVPGSLAAILNPTCNLDPAINEPGIAEASGGTGRVAAMRPQDGFPLNVAPEKSQNLSAGFRLAPRFLRGFQAQATYWNVFIRGVLTSVSINNGDDILRDPLYTPFFYLRKDNADFATVLQALEAGSDNQVDPSFNSTVTVINDAGTINGGFAKYSGIDFNMSYTTDLLGGAVTAGVTGSFFLRRVEEQLTGAGVSDDLSFGVFGNLSLPRTKARFNLGWTDGTYTVNTFVNYSGHYFAGSGYSGFTGPVGLIPAFTTMDLALGYSTGQSPANEYFRELSFTLVINDIFDRVAPFNYNTGGNPAAYDDSQGYTLWGRTLTFIVSKQW